MAKEFGAKGFTLNSLVRLRCAGKNTEDIATKPQEREANRYFTNFPKPLLSVERQIEFAGALDTLFRKLSKHNKCDLKNSETTLAADGTLGAPRALWVIDPEVASANLVPKSDQLHPRLHESRVVAGLCQTFDIARWAREVAQKALTGTASDDELAALYSHILATHGQFDRTTKTTLRKSPVMRDHQGRWVEPASITEIRVAGASHLEPVLHFPHPDYERDSKLKRALRLRKKISGEDVIKYANLVTKQPEFAERFEDALWKLRRLLTPETISKLAKIAFVRNSLGGLTLPSRTYLPTPLNKSCLGQESPFTASEHSYLFEKLGCRKTPRSEDILRHIKTLRDRQEQPTEPRVLYTTLVEALKQERRATNSHVQEKILWVQDDFYAPTDVLIGTRHKKVFLSAVPQISGPPIRQPAEILGAHLQPQSHHWLQLFRWYAKKYNGSNSPVPEHERYSLREAYSRLSRLDSLPNGVPTDGRILLDREGLLHSLGEAEEGTYVIDDDPRLAEAVSQQSAPVSFADTTAAGSLSFYSMVGVNNLTHITTRTNTTIGESVAVLGSLDVDSLLEKLHSIDFASAVTALAEYELRTHSEPGTSAPFVLMDQLKARTRIEFVEELTVSYRVANCIVVVPEEVLLEDNRIVCAEVSSMSALRDLMSNAVSKLLTEDISLQRRLADSIYRLLDSPSPKEMERYLGNRGIHWLSASMPQIDGIEDDLQEDNEAQDGDAVDEHIRKMLSDDLARDPVDQLERGSEGETTPGHPSQNPTPTDGSEHGDPWQLPPIGQVSPRSLPRGDSLPRRDGSAVTSGGSPSQWMPPTPTQEERDREIGRRGEEIIYRQEVDRVKALGFDESKVEWVSKGTPGADHDIQSVDDDGQRIWIEVKSTSGRDGRFRWSKAEFDKARRHRDRYILYRVYEADSLTPSVKEFRDPVRLLLEDAMRLNINTLSAEVEPLKGL